MFPEVFELLGFTNVNARMSTLWKQPSTSQYSTEKQDMRLFYLVNQLFLKASTINRYRT